jgi:L-amino acid N-acyltransferase YncA
MSDALRIRSAEASDAGAIAEIYRPYVDTSMISFETCAPEAEQIAERMLTRPRLPWLVAVRDDAVVGYAYASAHRSRAAYRWSADCSVYLQEPEQGRGTGRRLYDALFGALRDLGYVNVFAGITLPNPASVGLHEAMGFTLVGSYRDVGFKFGAWHDVGWWQLSLRQPPCEPAEPIEWPG